MVRQLEDLAAGLRAHLAQLHLTRLATSVLHDNSQGGWAQDKEFYEVSFCFFIFMVFLFYFLLICDHM